MEFPIYRKLSGGQKYYRIISDSEWEEAYRMGKRLVRTTHQAVTFTDRNHVQDLLDENSDHVLASSEEEWNALIRGSEDQ